MYLGISYTTIVRKQIRFAYPLLAALLNHHWIISIFLHTYMDIIVNDVSWIGNIPNAEDNSTKLEELIYSVQYCRAPRTSIAPCHNILKRTFHKRSQITPYHESPPSRSVYIPSLRRYKVVRTHNKQELRTRRL